MFMKLLGTISMDSDVVDQLLIVLHSSDTAERNWSRLEQYVSYL
jgi:hypothetical protein